MPVEQIRESKSAHQLAYLHYLRTGQRLTTAQWLARQERKFNPYHDELGRFTSPPGVTVSWGKYGPPSERRANAGRRRNATERGNGTSRAEEADTNELPRSKRKGPPAGFRSELVRNSVAPQTSHAETYFELNKRQASLNLLREEAGPDPDPVVKADLDDFQKRLDADRSRLDELSRVADQELNEILRAGLAPIDVGVGAINIASGDAEARDYFAVAGAVPIGGVIGKVGRPVAAAPRSVVNGVTQFGGSYSTVRKLRGYHAHHVPADQISPISKGRGPAVAMLPKDHLNTASHGRGPAARAYRKAQADLIAKGDFRGAIRMDIDDIRGKFGSKYDDAIEQMLEYVSAKGF